MGSTGHWPVPSGDPPDGRAARIETETLVDNKSITPISFGGVAERDGRVAHPLPENVNYAVKSGYLVSFLEVFADGQLKLKEANGKEIKFEEVVEQAKQTAVLVLIY